MAISRSTIISSFLWKLMEKMSVQAISFVVSVILARILCPEDYGIVTLMIVFINIANVTIDGGMNVALIQKKDATQEDFSTIFWINVCMSMILYAVMFVAAPWIAILFDNEQFTAAIRVLSLCLFPYAINSIQRAYIARSMLFKKLFISNLWATILCSIIGITLAYGGYKHWALIWFHIAQATVLAIVMWFTVKWRPSWVFSKESFRTLFDYGWKIFLSSLSTTLFVNTRSMMLGKFYSPAALAYFERGKHLPALVMENINSSIQAVLFPAFSQEQSNWEKVSAMLRRSVSTCNLFILPIMMWLIVSAEEIIQILLTEKWIGTVPYVQIFSLSYMLMPIQIANMEVIKSLGRSDLTLKISLIKIALDIIILLGAFSFGPLAIAASIVIFNTICLYINLWPLKSMLNISICNQLRNVVPELSATLVMGTFTYAVGLVLNDPFLALILKTLMALVSYLSCCHLFRLESFAYIRNVIAHR